MRMGISADHHGYEWKAFLSERLRAAGHVVTDFGAHRMEPADDYSDTTVPLALAICRRQVDRGITIGGRAVGACIMANKIPGVRAASLRDAEAIRAALEEDGMNVLCLDAAAGNIESAWSLARAFSGARRQLPLSTRRRLLALAGLERLLGVAAAPADCPA